MMPDNKKQWFLLILAVVWVLLALILPAVAYITTQDVRALGIAMLIVPPVAMLSRLYHYHFPPSGADYELQKLKFQIKSDHACNCKRAWPEQDKGGNKLSIPNKNYGRFVGGRDEKGQ